jgi:hypothetical protein
LAKTFHIIIERMIATGQVDEAQKNQDFLTAKSLLSSVREMMKPKAPTKSSESVIRQSEDPYIIQRLALLTYKSKYPTEKAALKEARELLAVLNPVTSNDTDLPGMDRSLALAKNLFDD